MIGIRIAFCLLVLTLFLFCSTPKQMPPLTALENRGYTRLSSSSEISSFLGQLACMYPVAQRVTIGKSAHGRPLHALLLSQNIHLFGRASATNGRVTVMIVGSQHGTEPSGAEAILLIVRDMAAGRLRAYLNDMNLIVIPNSNPDGRDLHRRGNGNGVNVSTNFTVLSEPESRALNDAMLKWKPEVVLDVHESAVLKKKSLARQGYLTDFEAQFEIVNNPNVDSQIRAFSLGRLLPEVISLTEARGLPAQRYIGEITDINQPITHGGLSLKNLRNKAGMMGSFSFLLENRLDPSVEKYPSPGNIRERVDKQYLSISAFLHCCLTHRAEIIRLSKEARRKWCDPKKEGPLYLVSTYVPDQSQPFISLPLRRLDTGERVEHVLAYHGVVANQYPLAMPMAYVVTAHQGLLKELLDRHSIRYEEAASGFQVAVTIQQILYRKVVVTAHRSDYSEYSVREHQAVYPFGQGDLWISLDQPARRLIPLLLEPRSMSSIFEDPNYSCLIVVGQEFFINRVYEPPFDWAFTDRLLTISLMKNKPF